MTTMRRTIKQFAALAAKTLPVEEPVFEFGALQVPGQEGFADIRPLFAGKEYVGADMREGPGVDVVLDLHSLDVQTGSVGTVLCLDTFEHVEHPREAINEIHRILKPAGVAIITSVMDFPIHDFPHDYWRFTPDGFKSLLQPFHHSFVGYAGKPEFPHSVVGVGFKGPPPDLSSFIAAYEVWKKRQGRLWNLELVDVVKLLTPPILTPLLARIYRSGRRVLPRSVQ